jgi:tetratricopeptide (TPR) repeat protein
MRNGSLTRRMKSNSQHAATDDKQGRNGPCGCGSGKKRKKCCGDSPYAASLAPSSDESARLAALFGSGRYPEAEELGKKLVLRYPGSGLAWKVLGAALAIQGKNALFALQRTTQCSPGDAEAHGNLGNALRSLGRTDEAAAAHRRAIALRPDYAEAHNNLGSALRDAGDVEAAEASYRRALDLKPDFGMASGNLATMLQELGRLDEAVIQYRRALGNNARNADLHDRLGTAQHMLGDLTGSAASHGRAIELKPNFGRAHGNLADVLRELGQLDQAVVAYTNAIAFSPGEAAFHNKLGNTYLDLGRPLEAITSYQRALDLSPDSAATHSNLASALRDLGRLAESEHNYVRALELKPDSAEIRTNLAIVLRLLNRGDDAEDSCKRALEIDPQLAAANTLLAKLRADRGLFKQAQHLLEQVIEVEPDFPEAWSGLAAVRKMTSADSQWLSQAERIAGKVSPRREVHLRYAIGKYYDDIEDYPAAFGNFQRANELTKSFRAAYRPAEMTNAIDSAVDSYGRDWLSRMKSSGIPSTRPVFVVGMPRSGTTLAEQILASHPAVFGANELTYWGRAFNQSASADRGDGAFIRRLAADYLRTTDDLSSDAEVIVDKMPTNFLAMGLIHAALPSARFIHMRRDPIDTCLSIYFQDMEATYSFANDLDDLAHYYGEYLRLMAHWQSVLPEGAVLDVPYESLVHDQESWSRKMVEFVGLPWNAACLEFHTTARNVSTLSNWQVRQKMSKSSVGRWRNYERFVAPLVGLHRRQP